MRMISALRMIDYGMGYDQQDELCQMSSSSASESLDAFKKLAIGCFGTEYLLHPNEADLRLFISITLTCRTNPK